MKIKARYIIKIIGVFFIGYFFYLLYVSDFQHWPHPLESVKAFLIMMMGLNLLAVVLVLVFGDYNSRDDLFVSKAFLIPVTTLMIFGGIKSCFLYGWNSHTYWNLLKYSLGLFLVYYLRWEASTGKKTPVKWDWQNVCFILFMLLAYFLPKIYF